jgi:Domain of unknown function (DUF4124)
MGGRPDSGAARQGGRIWPFMLVLLLLVAGTAWWYFAPDSMPEPLRRVLPRSARANPPLYRWHDAQGHVQVTDTPPADRPYETLQYDPKTNVVPSDASPPQRHEP